ncbi:ABC transporter ATP-binding protein [Tardiphaga sp.]|jgi:peptide/nickel transport system ATP-binding protein|uniref:ABC transporter ATP-binding protein n=1 Tax=Tardiphaga sp. TaxID=1926292 RepID=UPI0037D9EE31
MSTETLMSVQDLHRSFTVGAGMFKPKRILQAVNGVTLDIRRGEVLGIVGESGCGKSTLARMLLGLIPATSGHVSFDGEDIATIDRKRLARRVQPVFQDPYSSLNPRQTLLDLVSLPLRVHGIGNGAEQRRRSLEMLDRVGLPARFADRLPGELSGGQRQRVAIARALVMKPEVLVCDEPTSALDVSVQSHILKLLVDLRAELGLTYIFISHNLAVVEHIASRVAVMYLGQVVELGDAAALFRSPEHPYTRALLMSVLTPEPGRGIPDPGLGTAYPDPLHPPTGCTFHPRCAARLPVCSAIVPPAITTPKGSIARCVLAQRETAS